MNRLVLAFCARYEVVFVPKVDLTNQFNEDIGDCYKCASGSCCSYHSELGAALEEGGHLYD